MCAVSKGASVSGVRPESSPPFSAPASGYPLAVSLFNASLSSIADGTRQNTPPNIRDINLRHGIKAATVVAYLLEKLHERQSGSEKTVRVGKVNVGPGGQAIVGNVQAG